MSWITWLEARIGFLGIPGLIRLIAILNALVFVLHIFQPEYVSLLTLNPARVMQGEVWRLVSYIFIPDVLMNFQNAIFGPLLFFLFLMVMIWIGDNLEQAWGPFRLTLFYFLGMLGNTIASFIVGGGGSAGGTTPFLLNLSLFFAFATLFPNVEIYAFLVIPVKVKWMALLSLAPILYGFVFGSWGVKATLLICFLNYFLFFGPTIVSGFRKRAVTHARRHDFESKKLPADEPLHRCAICKRTEKDNPELEFRVARDGEEYCTDHLPKPLNR
jgi:hypothetical protein